MTQLSCKDISNFDTFNRTAELNLSPVLRRRKTGTKGRKKGRRGEVPPPAEGVRREECSRPPLLDHTTVVHMVGKTQTCRVFSSDEYLTSEYEMQLNILLCFQVLRRGSCSGAQSGAGLSQREAAIPSRRRKPKRNRYQSFPDNPGFAPKTAEL